MSHLPSNTLNRPEVDKIHQFGEGQNPSKQEMKQIILKRSPNPKTKTPSFHFPLLYLASWLVQFQQRQPTSKCQQLGAVLCKIREPACPIRCFDMPPAHEKVKSQREMLYSTRRNISRNLCSPSIGDEDYETNPARC